MNHFAVHQNLTQRESTILHKKIKNKVGTEKAKTKNKIKQQKTS